MGYALLIPYIKKFYPQFPPIHEKQIVFPTYGQHNHLGDYIGALFFPLFLFFITKKKKFIQIILVLIFIGITLSFSRSAYISLCVTGIIWLFTNRFSLKRTVLALVFFGFMILMATAFFLSLDSQSFFTPYTKSFSYPIISRGIGIERINYFTNAVATSIHNPLFGIGIGNYHYTTLLQANARFITDSVHNIMLETAVEQGLPALFFFIIIGFLVILKALKENIEFTYILIFLTLNFQTDYTYQIRLFMMLYVLAAAITYREPNDVMVPRKIFGGISILLGFICIVALLSSILVYFHQPKLALRLYPLKKDAYISLFTNTDQPIDKIEIYINNAQAVAPLDRGILLAIAQLYEKNNKPGIALIYYKQMYKLNFLVSFEVIKRIYFLTKIIFSEYDALLFLKEVSLNYSHTYPWGNFKQEFARFCLKERGEKCWETGWYK